MPEKKKQPCGNTAESLKKYCHSSSIVSPQSIFATCDFYEGLNLWLTLAEDIDWQTLKGWDK